MKLLKLDQIYLQNYLLRVEQDLGRRGKMYLGIEGNKHASTQGKLTFKLLLKTQDTSQWSSGVNYKPATFGLPGKQKQNFTMEEQL